MSLRTLVLLAAVGLAAGVPRSTADWPQILGPNRDGVYTGPPLVEAWGTEGPRVVWKKTVGQGLAGPAVVGGRVILFHRQTDREIVEALDAATGKAIWRYGYPTTYRDDFGFDEGPRAVPVVANGVVYTFGAEGQLNAIDLEKGSRVWSLDAARRYDVPKGFFGAAGSPLVEDGRVLANIGGKDAGIVAFDAKTGKELWRATKDEASYSSPAAAVFGGKRLALFLTRNGLVGLEPATGAIQFQQAWRSRSLSSVNVATPLVQGDLIFVSAEYGPGAGVLQVKGNALTPLWTSNDALSNHYATSVLKDGILYGFHGRQEYGPSLRAVELRTGKVRWNVDQFRAGSVILAGGRLVIVRESGEVVIAPASPDGFKPIAKAQVLTGTARALPALSDGFLYLRNEQTLVCLDLRK